MNESDAPLPLLDPPDSKDYVIKIISWRCRNFFPPKNCEEIWQKFLRKKNVKKIAFFQRNFCIFFNVFQFFEKFDEGSEVRK